jgi:hypothetical protein
MCRALCGQHENAIRLPSSEGLQLFASMLVRGSYEGAHFAANDAVPEDRDGCSVGSTLYGDIDVSSAEHG